MLLIKVGRIQADNGMAFPCDGKRNHGTFDERHEGG